MQKLPGIYNIFIELEGTNPTVWRRLFIQSDLFLTDFHKIIQTTMGWENINEHVFIKNGHKFGCETNIHSNDVVSYTSLLVNDFLKKKGDSLYYLYDFNDKWNHRIVLEDIIINPKNYYYPFCFEGENSCPPEGSGGTTKYIDIIRIYDLHYHPDNKKIVEKYGDDLDPYYFEIDDVNQFLLEDDFGCPQI